jgi:predicted  nucleic acid-binding Zn-ribbon protein
MPSVIPQLLGLQDIDLQLDARRDALDADEARLGESDELLAARSAVTEAETARGELGRAQRQIEADVEDARERVAPLETKLYGGTIKNPKELQELDHQVTTFKGALQEQEARLIDHLAAIEAQDAALDEARTTLVSVEEAWGREQERLRGEIEVLRREIAGLEERRAEHASRIDPQSLRTYDMLRPRTGGRVVARVERGMCTGCRISIPSAVISRARAGAVIAQCPSCQRILLAN